MAVLGTCSDLLVGLFELHGVEAVHNQGIVTVASHPGLQIALEVHETVQEPNVEMRAILSLSPGKSIVLPFLGMGTTQKEALMEAQTYFVNLLLHVIMSAIFSKPNKYCDEFDWTMGGVERRVTCSPVVWRGQPFPREQEERWLEYWHDKVRSFPLAEGFHWIDVFIAQAKGEVLSCSVLIDEENCKELEDAVLNYDWPKEEKFYSIRQFMILQGGFDCADAISLFMSPEQEENLIESLVKNNPSLLRDGIAERYVRLGILAFGRRLLSRYPSLGIDTEGVALDLKSKDAVAFKLADDWIFRDMERIARSFPLRLPQELFESIAHRSAEVHAAMQCLEQDQLDGARMMSPMLPMQYVAFKFLSRLPSAGELSEKQFENLKYMTGG